MTPVLMLLSDTLNVLTVVLCLVLKVPQIFRLIKSGEAAGLSLNALLVELLSYTVTMMYNYTNQYALWTYLEYPIIIIQEYILIASVIFFKKIKFIYFIAVLLFYGSLTLAFAYSILPKFILSLVLPLTTPMSAFSKIMQLMTIISSKNAQSVSVMSWFLSFFTNASRMFTVYMDSADINLLLNLSVSSVLSGAVMVAAIYYQKLSSGKKPE